MKSVSPNRNIRLNIMGLILGSIMVSACSRGGAAGTLQFSTQTVAVNTGAEADARGKINVSMNGNNETLKISLAKLDPLATYQLVALVGDDTNGISITTFTTDRKGAFDISYLKKAHVHSNLHRQILPTALDPLCNVRELDVLHGSPQVVLRAVLTSPDKGKYAAHRSMVNPGFLPSAAGNLLIQSRSGSSQFRLQASGLAPATDYRLVINGEIFPINTSDHKGKLNVTALPSGSPDALNIQTLALADASGTNIILISGGMGIPCSTAAQSSLNLHSAASFAVLAGSTATSTGNTEVTGNLGVWAGTDVTGFQGIVPGGPGIVHGNIHAGDSVAQIAEGDLTTAFNDAAGRTLAPVDVANADLGGRTLAPGLYKSTGTLALTGTVVLDAQGDQNATWIFQIASSLDTATGSAVILSGGAKASHVFWQVGTSATLATTTSFKGTIMADQSISLANGATLEGRALARIAGVTMDSNAITLPAP